MVHLTSLTCEHSSALSDYRRCLVVALDLVLDFTKSYAAFGSRLFFCCPISICKRSSGWWSTSEIWSLHWSRNPHPISRRKSPQIIHTNQQEEAPERAQKLSINWPKNQPKLGQTQSKSRLNSTQKLLCFIFTLKESCKRTVFRIFMQFWPWNSGCY